MTELQMLAMAYVFFLGLIGVEMAISRIKADGGYRVSEMVVNIGHGVVYQVFDFLTKGLAAIPFLFVASLVTWDVLPADAWWAWLIGLIVYDLSSYWVHRHHHEIHALWAIHGVHHAAEDYNLAAALRQAAFQKVTAWPWRLPLALIMPIEMFIGIVVFDFLYQFLTHTRYVPKLGAIEWIFNTPSHHRVHHGRDAKYLDKNYGCIFIVWDRLFGTFAAEQEEPDYGLTKPLHTLNSVWGNFAIFSELVGATRRAVGSNKALVWLTGPAHLARLAPKHHGAAPRQHPDRLSSRRMRWYVGLSGLLIPPLLGWMMMKGDSWGFGLQLACAAWIVVSVVAAGGLLERRAWAWPLEAARVAAGVLAVGAVVL